jgi:hypothetical protein
MVVTAMVFTAERLLIFLTITIAKEAHAIFMSKKDERTEQYTKKSITLSN